MTVELDIDKRTAILPQFESYTVTPGPTQAELASRERVYSHIPFEHPHERQKIVFNKQTVIESAVTMAFARIHTPGVTEGEVEMLNGRIVRLRQIADRFKISVDENVEEKAKRIKVYPKT